MTGSTSLRIALLLIPVATSLSSVPSQALAQGLGQTVDVIANELSLEDLLNVDVTTVSKFNQKQADAPGIITVLSSDELKRFGGTTLRDVLDRVPGLNASGGYLTDRATVAARGDQVRVNSGHVLLLINGRPVRETMEGGLSSDMFERFPLDAIDHIEVIKGPGSVLYGSDAFAGVINVLTKKPQSTGASVTRLLGSDWADESAQTLTVEEGGFRLLATASYLRQPDWKTSYNFQNTPADPVVALPINAPDKGMGAFLDATYKGFRLMSAYTDWESWYHLKGIINQGKWQKVFNNLGYEYQINQRWRTELNLGMTNALLDFHTNRPFVKRNSYEVVGEWTNFIDLARNSRLVVGGLIDGRRGKEINYAVPTAPRTTTSAGQVGFEAYAQMDYRPVQPLKLIGGVQVNKMKDIELGIVPRAGLIVSPFARLNLKLLYSQAYRAPSISELYLADTNLRGTLGLKPETVSTLDGSVSYQGRQVQLAAGYFYSDEKNIIRPTVAPGATGVNALQYYTNTSRVTIQGAEFEGKVYVDKSLYASASLLYQKSKNDAGASDVTPIPALTTKAGASYASGRGFVISLFDLYLGTYGNIFTRSTLLNPAPKAHHVLSLHGELDVNKVFGLRFKPTTTLLLQINNMLDDKYYVPEWGGTVHDSQSGTMGRTIYAGLNVAL